MVAEVIVDFTILPEENNRVLINEHPAPYEMVVAIAA